MAASSSSRCNLGGACPCSFSIPSSDRMAASTLLPWLVAWEQEILSVSLRRIEWLHRTLAPGVPENRTTAFSIPSSDRMAASGRPATAQRSPTRTFSIPSSDRMAASWCWCFPSRTGRWRLSVSLRRIEWLHRTGAALAASARGCFQYPFVGSNGCIFRRCAGRARRVRRFQYPFVGSNGCIRRTLGLRVRTVWAFSIPSSDRMAASPRRRRGIRPGRAFSIPSSDRMAASAASACWGEGGSSAFSIPSSDRMAASSYDSPAAAQAAAAFSIPSSDRMAASLFHPPLAGGQGQLSVSLRRIEWLHPDQQGRCCASADSLSVSLRRIEWLHRPLLGHGPLRDQRHLSVSLRRIEWLHPECPK